MQNGGQRNRQGGDVGQCIEICRACAVAHPQPFLTCGFEAGIVTLTLCTQGVCSLETEATAVNGMPRIPCMETKRKRIKRNDNFLRKLLTSKKKSVILTEPWPSGSVG